MRIAHFSVMAAAVAMGFSMSSAFPSAQRQQPTSAGVLSEHHLEVLDSMTPQAQAEFLLERAINRYQGSNEQIRARVGYWHGKIELNERLNGLFMIALNSDDLAVRASAIELDLAALNLEKRVETIDRLEADARQGAQGPRANALWRIGLLGNRGVQPERAFEILIGSIHDENVNVRYWAVEGLAYLGTEDIITPLLAVFHDDTSPMIRERAACSLAQSGMLSAALRLTAVPRLLDFADDPTLDDQTRSWVFQALRDITGQSLPRQPSAWRDWYVRSLRR
jgi:HEAT repeat protein